jgi:hypothetical protein
MFVAQALNPEAVQIGLWVIAGTAVLQAVGAALSIARFLLNRSENRQVRITADVVSRPDFDAHMADNNHEHEKLFSKLGGLERGINAHLNSELKSLREERNEDVRGLHCELNVLAKTVSGLEATNCLQSQRLAEINAKLDRVIERQGTSGRTQETGARRLHS